MEFEQLSIFPHNDNDIESQTTSNKNNDKKQIRSEKILSGIYVVDLPFMNCDYDTIYPKIKALIPSEQILFSNWELDKLIMAEIICAGICHQMNWDYLRSVLFNKMKNDSNWVLPDKLTTINSSEISELFSTYEKQERVRSTERASLLNSIGKWASEFESIDSIFFDSNTKLLPEDKIRNNLLKCVVFSMDPEEKKLQLLLQKLSMYSLFEGLAYYCHPAIDYHLVRIYLRRGLIYGKTPYVKEYLNNPSLERKEETIASVRHLCAKLMNSICEFTHLSIIDVNQIDWHIGRSICIEGKPDCNLESNDSNWLKPTFKRCPYYDTCIMRINNNDYSKIQEPKYCGPSY